MTDVQAAAATPSPLYQQVKALITRGLAEKLTTEPKQEAVKDTLDAIKAGKEIDEWPIESFGLAMGPSLAEAGVIMPYSRAKIFTRGWEGKFQAHHLLEADMAEKTFDLDAKAINDIPAIILSDVQHTRITNTLNAERAKILPGVNPRDIKPHEIWKVYQKAYRDNPAWLDAIEGYFKK